MTRLKMMWCTKKDAAAAQNMTDFIMDSQPFVNCKQWMENKQQKFHFILE